jgi:hypothetical protein
LVPLDTVHIFTLETHRTSLWPRPQVTGLKTNEFVILRLDWQSRKKEELDGPVKSGNDIKEVTAKEGQYTRKTYFDSFSFSLITYQV